VSFLVFVVISVDPLLLDKLRIPQILSRYQDPPSSPLTFSWSQCGGNGATIKNLTIIPDPIQLPGNITVRGAVTVVGSVSSTSIVTADLSISKKIEGFWIPVPCLDNIGSCTYDDPCSLLATVKDKVCPVLTAANLPCQCPIAPGNYATPAAGLNIHLSNPGWSWLTDGDVYLKVI